MPATNAFQPAGLSQGAKDVVKSYGDWTGFTQSYGIKSWEPGAAEEGRAIAEGLAKVSENSGDVSKSGGSSKKN